MRHGKRKGRPHDVEEFRPACTISRDSRHYLSMILYEYTVSLLSTVRYFASRAYLLFIRLHRSNVCSLQVLYLQANWAPRLSQRANWPGPVGVHGTLHTVLHMYNLQRIVRARTTVTVGNGTAYRTRIKGQVTPRTYPPQIFSSG